MPPVIRTEPLNANGHANADDDDDPGAVAFPAADVHDRRPTPEPNPQPLQVAIPGRRPRSPSPWRTPTPPSHPSRPLHQPRIPWGDVKHDLAHPPKGSHDPRTKAEKRLLGDYGKPRNGIAFPSPEHQSMNWMDEVEVIRGKHVQPKPGASSSFRPRNLIDSSLSSSSISNFNNSPHGLQRRHEGDKARAIRHGLVARRDRWVHRDDLSKQPDSPSHGPSIATKRRRSAELDDDVVVVVSDDDTGPPPSRSNPNVAPKRASLPISISSKVTQLANSRRKRSRDGSPPKSHDMEERTTSHLLTHERLAQGPPKRSPMPSDDDEDPIQTLDGPPSRNHSSHRINMSTAPSAVTLPEHRQWGSRGLQNFSRSELKKLAGETSEDELQAPAQPPHVKPRRSPLNDPLSFITPHSVLLPLKRARSFFWSLSAPGLFLVFPNPHGSVLVIYQTSTSQDGKSIVQKNTIKGDKIDRIHTDERTLLRFMGPANPYNALCVDLEFETVDDLDLARTGLNNISNVFRILSKTSEDMRKVWKQELKPSRSVMETHGISDRDFQLNTYVNGEITNPHSRDPQLNDGELRVQRKQHPMVVIQQKGIISRLLEPRRSDRKRQTVVEISDDAPPEDVEPPIRFSQEFGLGKRWSRPLEYKENGRRAVVDFDDLLRLDEGQELNDNLITFYMNYLYNHANLPAGKVYTFSTHFFERFQADGYQAVATWTRKEDIFTYEYLAMPIHDSHHWYLALICNVNNLSRQPILEGSAMDVSTEVKSEPITAMDVRNEVEIIEIEDDSKRKADTAATAPVLAMADKMDESGTDAPPKGITSESPAQVKPKRRGPPLRKYDPEEPVIIILDSLALSRTGTVRKIKGWIMEEAKQKRNMDVEIKQNGVYPKGDVIPTQENGVDCGVFLLGYFQKFVLAPRDFVTRVLQREMKLETDWPEMSAPHMRNRMRSILMGMGPEQHEKRKKQHLEKRRSAEESPSQSRHVSSEAERQPQVPSSETVIPETPEPEEIDDGCII